MRKVSAVFPALLSLVLVALVVVAAVVLTFHGSLVATNPFQAAIEGAARAGGWSAEEMVFERGEYRFRLVYTVARADFHVTDGDRCWSGRVKASFVPLRGWEVVHFQRKAVPAVASASTTPADTTSAG